MLTIQDINLLPRMQIQERWSDSQSQVSTQLCRNVM